jgi:AraC-like DNA-binding protein
MPSAGALRDVANGARTPIQAFVVAVCVPDLRLQARVTDAMRGHGTVRTISSFAALVQQLRVEPLDVVILPPRDASGCEAAPIVREIVRGSPQTALVAYLEPRYQGSSDIRALAIAGVHQFLFVGEDSRLALLSLLESARRECAAEQVMQRLASVFDERIQPIVEICLMRPAEIRSVDDLVAASRLHRKTLYNRTRRAGLSGPAELIAWCRLALAAFILRGTAKTVETVADELEFASPTALRNMMKRYTGLRASDVRAAGGLECIATALTARLTRNASCLHVM